MISQWFFWIWTLSPRTHVPPFLGGGVGGGHQNFFVYCRCCVCIWTCLLKNFFLLYGPPNPWRGSRVPTPGTPGRPPPPPIWPLASEDLAVLGLFSGT